jgi:hypothetical protein
VPPHVPRSLGILFLLPFFSYGIGTALVTSVLKDPAHLAAVVGQRTPFIGGALLRLLNSITVVGIGVLFFPILRERSPSIAVAYVCTHLPGASPGAPVSLALHPLPSRRSRTSS